MSAVCPIAEKQGAAPEILTTEKQATSACTLDTLSRSWPLTPLTCSQWPLMRILYYSGVLKLCLHQKIVFCFFFDDLVLLAWLRTLTLMWSRCNIHTAFSQFLYIKTHLLLCRRIGFPSRILIAQILIQIPKHSESVYLFVIYGYLLNIGVSNWSIMY